MIIWIQWITAWHGIGYFQSIILQKPHLLGVTAAEQPRIISKAGILMLVQPKVKVMVSETSAKRLKSSCDQFWAPKPNRNSYFLVNKGIKNRNTYGNFSMITYLWNFIWDPRHYKSNYLRVGPWVILVKSKRGHLPPEPLIERQRCMYCDNFC